MHSSPRPLTGRRSNPSQSGCHARFRARFLEVIRPIHEDFNAFLEANGEAAYPRGQFQHEIADWGIIPTMLAGQSHTSGRLLHVGAGGQLECGIWRCTPGKWSCHVTRDEFCHFLAGRCTYEHESGEIIEIEPDTVAFFQQDWKGVCTVHETVTKIYMIR